MGWFDEQVNRWTGLDLTEAAQSLQLGGLIGLGAASFAKDSMKPPKTGLEAYRKGQEQVDKEQATIEARKKRLQDQPGIRSQTSSTRTLLSNYLYPTAPILLDPIQGPK